MKCPKQKDCLDFFDRNFTCNESAEWCTKSGIKKIRGEDGNEVVTCNERVTSK